MSLRDIQKRMPSINQLKDTIQTLERMLEELIEKGI